MLNRSHGVTGDKLNVLLDEEDKTNDDIIENSDSRTASLIGYKAPFYYCQEHPKVQNINLESIMHHLECSTDHKKESIAEEKQLV